MKTIIILIALLFTFACSQTGSNKDVSGENYQKTPVAPLSEKTKKILNDKAQFIGFINRFEFSGGNEAYIELYFRKEPKNEEEYDKIVKLADSLIYQDEDNSRHYFPENLATDYFDLSGLFKLNIYDKHDKLFCKAEFLRVEYLNQNISSAFIAVFKTEKLINSDEYYGISNFNEIFAQKNFSIAKDSILTKKIMTRLTKQKTFKGLENNGQHLYFTNNDTVLSIVNAENFAYIVLGKQKDFKVLYKSPVHENMIDLRVIPINKSGLPCILTKNIKPDSDIMWENLFIFNGQQYANSSRQRRM